MEQEINKAIEVLKNGGTILYPTDTIWGIGCDATNENAVNKILSLKNRSQDKGMLILLDDEKKLLRYVSKVPKIAYDLIRVSEKPLTIIYSNAINLAKNVIPEDGSIAIRIVKDEFCRRLIQKFRKPIVSTSANKSGDKFPATFYEIDKCIKENVDYIVNWRKNEKIKGSPSSIIKLEDNGEIKIIRK